MEATLADTLFAQRPLFIPVKNGEMASRREGVKLDALVLILTQKQPQELFPPRPSASFSLLLRFLTCREAKLSG